MLYIRKLIDEEQAHDYAQLVKHTQRYKKKKRKKKKCDKITDTRGSRVFLSRLIKLSPLITSALFSILLQSLCFYFYVLLFFSMSLLLDRHTRHALMYTCLRTYMNQARLRVYSIAEGAALRFCCGCTQVHRLQIRYPSIISPLLLPL